MYFLGSNKIDRSVRKFLEILALCHTVQVAPKRVTKSTKNLKVSLRDPGELAYNASRSVGLWNFKFGDICCPVLTSPNPKNKIRLDQNVLEIHQFSSYELMFCSCFFQNMGRQSKGGFICTSPSWLSVISSSSQCC